MSGHRDAREISSIGRWGDLGQEGDEGQPEHRHAEDEPPVPGAVLQQGRTRRIAPTLTVVPSPEVGHDASQNERTGDGGDERDDGLEEGGRGDPRTVRVPSSINLSGSRPCHRGVEAASPDAAGMPLQSVAVQVGAPRTSALAHLVLDDAERASLGALLVPCDPGEFISITLRILVEGPEDDTATIPKEEVVETLEGLPGFTRSVDGLGRSGEAARFLRVWKQDITREFPLFSEVEVSPLAATRALEKLRHFLEQARALQAEVCVWRE